MAEEESERATEDVGGARIGAVERFRTGDFEGDLGNVEEEGFIGGCKGKLVVLDLLSSV